LADRSKAIELNPDLPEAWYARGSAYYLLGDYAKAASDLAQALRLRPDYKADADVLAKAQERLKAAENEAEKEAKNVAPPAPATPAAPVAKIEPPAQPTPPPPAPSPIPTRAVVPAGTEQEHEARGRAFTQAEKFPEALAELTEAIQIDSKAARAYNARGYVYLRLRDYQRALADFDNAIGLDPKYANAYMNRAATRKALGDAAGAAKDVGAAANFKAAR
jgi:tetratricopeptide (TPR) repeat protein